MNDEQRKALEQAGIYTFPVEVPEATGAMDGLIACAHALNRIADCDCCGMQECTDDAPWCDARAARVAVAKLRRIIEPEHKTLNPDRLGNPAEAIYFHQWRKLQERSPGVNGGRGYLELLLTPTRQRQEFGYVPPVSPRDAAVAATVIQWLGTSCGCAFLRECERQCAVANATRGVIWELTANQDQRGNVTAQTIASEVLSGFIRGDDPRYGKLHERLASVIGGILNSKETK